MIELSEDLKKLIKCIPLHILSELWDITQEIPYIAHKEGGIKWRKIDELSQLISYAHRESNNPEHIHIKFLDTINKELEL